MIEELSEDIIHLESLEWLNLGGTCVKHLPNSICMLKHLKTLLLARCKVLEKLPEDLGLLESLEELSLACSKIRDVPNSICKLTHLREFNLRYCDQLKKLPDKLGDLKCLQRLNVHGTRLSNLPESISLLKGLKIIGFTLGDSSIHSSAPYTTMNNNNSGVLKKYAGIKSIMALRQKLQNIDTRDIRCSSYLSYFLFEF